MDTCVTLMAKEKKSGLRSRMAMAMVMCGFMHGYGSHIKRAMHGPD
jgi:hypothetical protein